MALVSQLGRRLALGNPVSSVGLHLSTTSPSVFVFAGAAGGLLDSKLGLEVDNLETVRGSSLDPVDPAHDPSR